MEPFTFVGFTLLGFLIAASSAHFETECYTANGEDYRGQQNQTCLQGGKPCLYWNETFQHPYNTVKYPNGEGGLGRHNYCRNPDGDVRPWCYIADHDDGVYWKYCDIPTCQMPGNLGCFRDSGDPPTLSGSSETSNKLTIQSCISFCRSRRYKLAGMESGYACFCGNDPDYRRQGEAVSTECNHVCFGDHTQPCGGDGRLIIFSTLVGACGGNYTAPTAVIYSPDFPDNYGSNRVCYWTIQVPGSSFLLFNFTFFDIRDATDIVELLDGYTNQVISRFDGRNQPQGLVNISADFAILYFYSDRNNQAQGFAVVYKALRKQDPSVVYLEEKNNQTEAESPSNTEKANLTLNAARSPQIFYVITSSPSKPTHNMPVWTIYALAALLTLTVIAMVAKVLLHLTVKSPRIPTISGSESCNQNPSTEPWIIFYRPSTISFFKKKLKNRHGDLSPLVSH
ncbi:kremen protein 1 [Polypterus senegalus]|uniref:kremen protein 1 n=1 Tax=Polypterus senegalus TaxID=55291 RepID=UPI001966A405|nr:kremen protein 1 [Polypterus senegalus]